MSSRSDSDEERFEEPVQYFLDDLSYHGKSDRTREAYRRVLRRFETDLRTERGRSGLEEATHRDCIAWLHRVRTESSSSTVATYASYLHRFYSYLTQVGVFDRNPMSLVMEELDESINTDPSRRDVSVPRMREFVARIEHPLHRAVVITFLKTGVRAGELCNLDARDIRLDGDTGGMLESPPRAQLDERPDSLYVSPDPKQGSLLNGERRTASNKRRRQTVIPIDAELKRELGRWLAIRPDPVSESEPLFVSTATNYGQRLTPDAVHHIVERHASAHGWYREGGGAEENVTPHYFRHFFTTHLRDRTGDRGIVKYLRGDVAQDVIDTYTHNWGDRVREVYEANIYRLTE